MFKDLLKKLNDEACLYNHEIKLGNTIQSDNIISCIYEGKLRYFELIKRDAEKGDIIQIINTNPILAIPEFTRGRFYKVTNTSEGCDIIRPYVTVNYYAVYPEQYLVLRELL